MNKEEKRVVFDDYVWPAISGLFGGGTLVHVGEKMTVRFLRDRARIDALYLTNGQDMCSLTYKVQSCLNSWDTFTIDYPKQYREWLRAIKYGYIYPYFLIQVYVDDEGGLLAAAMIRTKDLLLFASAELTSGLAYIESNQRRGQFVVVPWRTLREKKIPLKVWHEEGTKELWEDVGCEK